MVEEVIELRGKGYSYKKIASELNVKFSKVRSISEKYNLNKNTNSLSAKQKFMHSIEHEYNLLSEYKNTTTYIRLEHKECGHVWDVQPRVINQGSRCPNCSKTFTHEEFINKLEKEKPNQYELISEYKNMKTKVKFKHKKCGYTGERLPANLLKARNCLQCSLEDRRLEREKDFILRLNEALGNEYTLNSNYVDNTTYVLLKHVCGREYSIHPTTIQKGGGGCPKCTDTTIKNKEDFLYLLEKRRHAEFQLIGEFIGMTTKTRFKHNECGNEFDIEPTKLVSKSYMRNCPHCCWEIARKQMMLSQEEFENKFNAVLGNDYELLSAYKGSEKKIKIKHSCGHLYFTKASHATSGHGCPNCSGHFVNTDIIKKRIEKVKGNEYKIISGYVDSKTPMEFKHVKCDTVFKAKSNDILSLKVACPVCKETRGEEKVRRFLEANFIKYIPQYTDERCKNRRALRFDFACFIECKLICLIEFDGLQHDKNIEFFGGKEGFLYRKQNDLIKETFCKVNNIPLIRIKYDQLNETENILSEKLTELNLIKEGQLSFTIT